MRFSLCNVVNIPQQCLYPTVDKGDKTEHEPQLQPQETKLLYGEIVQCNGDVENNIPITYGLPLEGKWAVYLSGETRNSNGSSGREVNEVTQVQKTKNQHTQTLRGRGWSRTW